jgi:hypothetical protein
MSRDFEIDWMTRQGRMHERTTAADLERVVLSNALLAAPAFMRLLAILRDLSLPQAYLAAGIVRNTYWARCHGFAFGHSGADVDLVFFEPERPLAEDGVLARELQKRTPGLVWDITNQAHVHAWYQAYSGVPITPLRSTIEGIALWPEIATCVGARLDGEERIEIVAPYGLTDLLNLRWSPNAACPDPSAFARRLAQKRVSEVWPLVKIVAS